MLVRLLVESADDIAAHQHAKALFEASQSLLESHPEWKKRTMICRLDQPGVTFLRGKHRWQVFFRILVHPATESLCGEISNLSRQEAPKGVDVWYEYNPTTMM